MIVDRLVNAQLFKIALEDEPLMDLDYEDIFKAQMPIERQQALMRRRQEFAEQSGISVSCSNTFSLSSAIPIR